MSRKRDREEDIQIKVAVGQPIDAESLMLRPFSSVARALPSDAQQWDVSGLLQDGQPFSRETVQCWLSCIYSSLHGPAELSAEDCQQLSTAKGLQQVLAFAHAVGSPLAVLAAACSQLDNLKFVVQLPAQTIELQLRDGPHRFGVNDEDSKQLRRATLRTCQADHCGSPCVSEAECHEVRQQVAQQVGLLLHMAHVVQLQALTQALHSFVLWNTRKQSSLLWGVLQLVFTDAVLAAAVGSTTQTAAYINSVLARPFSVMETRTGEPSLLKPLGTIEATDDGQLEFEAQLLQDVAGSKAGDTVSVLLDLFDPDGGYMNISIDDHTPVGLSAQLLVGHTTLSQDFAGMMSSNMGQSLSLYVGYECVCHVHAVDVQASHLLLCVCEWPPRPLLGNHLIAAALGLVHPAIRALVAEYHPVVTSSLYY